MPKVSFRRYSLHIDPTFWSTLYGKKLDEWKLDDTEKECCAFVHGNAVYLDRSSLSRGLVDSSERESATKPETRLSGIVRVFNTRNVLKKYYEDNQVSLLRSGHQFIMLVHADLKRYIFDYYFALPTMYPSVPFVATLETATVVTVATSKPVVSMIHDISKENQTYFLPEVIRNEIFKEYKQGVRLFEFLFPPKGKIRLNIRCPEYAKSSMEVGGNRLYTHWICRGRWILL